MEVVSDKLIRVVSRDGDVIRWLHPDRPVELSADLAMIAIELGAVPTGEKPKTARAKKVEKIVDAMVEKLKSVAPSLADSDFTSDGKPRMEVFSSINGATLLARDKAWDIYTESERGT